MHSLVDMWFILVGSGENYTASYRVSENSKGETPAMVFTKEHMELVKKGEKWMKQAATGCSLATTLVTTIVFAAAISVPGGNGDNGKPKFSHERSFIIFDISDALSLLSSIAAMIMFLSMLITGYAEDNFFYVLPNRLISGLVLLFVSVTSMMVDYGATVYLVFYDRKAHWILAFLGASVCSPVFLFVYLKLPLLVDFVFYTYGPGISLK
ncbi:uncharacterized protein LOC116119248 isoform X1 [Pistacia vera]|uniref:uncharacterized protein LOC116119248 isoform X1 n=1 Tax=Pistacia vera TaxID=55513 RepID=UPI0012631866|nr:uncharacterized protein LOC116119248 isoform X1 [Pistacia vera]